jgi:hypothetical protein
MRLLEVNATPSLVLGFAGEPTVITGEAARGRITAIWV